MSAIKLLKEKLGIGGRRITPFVADGNLDQIIRAVVDSLAGLNGLTKSFSGITALVAANPNAQPLPYVQADWGTVDVLLLEIKTVLLAANSGLTLPADPTVAPVAYDEAQSQTVVDLLQGIRDSLVDSTVLDNYPYLVDAPAADDPGFRQQVANATLALKEYVNAFANGELPIGM